MQKRPNPISMFVMIGIIGLVVSFLTGDFEIGSFIDGLEVDNIEVLLEYLSLGLGFLTMASLFIVLMVRASKGDRNYYWDFEKGDKKEDQVKKEYFPGDEE